MKKVKKKNTSSKQRLDASAPKNGGWLASSAVLLAVSVVVLAVASRNSFCYLNNYSVQTNSLFTIGRNLLNGQVPYQDIFGLDGIIVYAIYALAAMIPVPGGIGVYIMEVIAMFFASFFVWKLARMFTDAVYACAAGVFYICLICSSPYFGTGGTAVEFGLPFVSAAVYLCVQLFYTDVYSGLKILMIGILGSLAFFVSPVFTGFWVAMLIVIILQQVFANQWVNCVLNLVWFFMGVAIPTLAIMIYFIAMTHLAGLIEVYIKLNFIPPENVSFFSIVRYVYLQAKQMFLSDYVVAALLILSLGIIAYTKNLFPLLFVILGFACSCFSVFWRMPAEGTASLPLLIFTVPGIIFILWLIYWIFSKTGTAAGVLSGIVFAGVILASGWLMYENGSWRQILNRSRETPMGELAKLINESEDKSLLNYGAADQGLYRAANVIPGVYYFQIADYPGTILEESIQAQNRYLADKKNEFVLTTSADGKEIDSQELKANYDLFKTITGDVNGQQITWQLYKRKPDESKPEENKQPDNENKEPENQENPGE